MKILVVDDDRFVLEMTKLMVERCGHEAIAVSDSALVQETIAREGIRVVISDWVMPGLSGLDLVRALRANPLQPYVYFIVLTGTKLGSLNFMEAMDAGADDYMEKPAEKDLLRIRLRVAQRILKLDTELNDLIKIIPICSHCKRVRRDDKAYESIEAYISKNSAVRFSHGICPKCVEKYYPEIK
ncbi:MAG: response regulator [Elusimicrobiales bacterium]|nr:response regulator [Elusimicrobiales bacterium]